MLGSPGPLSNQATGGNMTNVSKSPSPDFGFWGDSDQTILVDPTGNYTLIHIDALIPTGSHLLPPAGRWWRDRQSRAPPVGFAVIASNWRAITASAVVGPSHYENKENGVKVTVGQMISHSLVKSIL